MKLYYISEDELTEEFLFPKYDLELDKTFIKAATSINGCLSAHSKKNENPVYVYTIETNSWKRPTKNDVPNVDLTGEVWITKPVKPKFFAKIAIVKEIKTKVSKLQNNLYPFELKD